MRAAFAEFSNWRESEKELRELRKKVTFAIFAEEDDLNKVTGLVDSIFTVLAEKRRRHEDEALERQRRIQGPRFRLGRPA